MAFGKKVGSVAALAAVAVLSLAVPAPAMDINGFMPAAGSGDFALSYTSEGYDEFWVGEAQVSDPGVGEVDITSLAAWLRWGFTDNLALELNVPYVDAESDGLGGFEDSGLQDLSALLKWRFFSSGPHNLLAAAGVRTAISDYEANLPVDLGDNTTDVLLRLVYHLQTPGGFFFSQQVGYDVRSDEAPDGFPLFTELGFNTGRVTVSGFYQQLTADSEGTDIGDQGFTFPSNREEYSRAGAKLFARFTDRVGGSAAYFTTLDGRNTGETSGFSVGGVLSF